MVKEIINRLQSMKSDIVNSPEFTNSATERARRIIDDVYSLVNRYGNVSDRFGITSGKNIVNKFGIGGNSIKSRLSILTSVGTLQNKINLSRYLTPTSKQIAINKLEQIKRIR